MSFLDPKRWTEGEWAAEDRQTALAAAPGYAREFFARLFAEYPTIQDETHFRRWSVQPSDLYAFFDGSPRSFFIQIDPESDDIIVGDEATHGEYGYWLEENDRIEQALAHVRLCRGGAAPAQD